MHNVLRDNGVSLALLLLFISALSDGASGCCSLNEQQHEHAQRLVTYVEYIASAPSRERSQELVLMKV